MKKYIGAALIAALTCSLFTGCSLQKTPTAEELINEAYPVDMETMEGNVNLSLSGSFPIEGLGETTKLEMSVKFDANMKSDSDTTAVDGNIAIKIFGMEMSQKMSSYTQREENVQIEYAYDENTNTWIYEETPLGEQKNRTLSADTFENLTMQETETEYIVTGNINLENMEDASGVNPVEMLFSMEAEINPEDLNFAAELIFDKKTKSLTKLTMTLNEYEKDDVTISKLTLSITDITFSNDGLNVPDDVIRGAVSADEFENYEIEETDDIDSMHAGEEEKEPEPEEGMEGILMRDEVYLAPLYLGVVSATSEDIVNFSKGLISEDDEVMIPLLTFINNYSPDTLLNYIGLWDYLDDDDKLASAYIATFGMIDAEDMIAAGANEEELTELINSINN